MHGSVDTAAEGPRTRKIRVVVAKPGLDGHDRGAKIIARALRDEVSRRVLGQVRNPNDHAALFVQTPAGEKIADVGFPLPAIFPAASGFVETALAGLRIDMLDHERVDVANRVRDALVRAVAPHHALSCLQLRECHVLSLVGRRGAYGLASTASLPPMSAHDGDRVPVAARRAAGGFQ